jgi:DegV family protein with EDD domain
MMATVSIVTDSLSCIPRQLVDQFKIGILPINILSGGKTYRDWFDLSPSQAYDLFTTDPDSFSTSPSTPSQCVDALSAAARLGSEVLCLTVSEKLSTVHNVARLSAEEVTRRVPGSRVTVMNTGTVLASEGLVALAAARAALAGKEFGEVVREAAEVRSRVHFALVLDSIKNVYRTGRVPKFATQAASVIPLKAILTVSSGVVRPLGVARNMKQGVERIVETLRARAGNRPVHVAVMHAFSPVEAEGWRSLVASSLNCVELWAAEVSPVVSYALGAGAIGLAYYVETSEEESVAQHP